MLSSTASNTTAIRGLVSSMSTLEAFEWLVLAVLTIGWLMDLQLRSLDR